ncbi:MAG: DegT/DnrJ/EryC1/StrS family aminotransferase [Haloarculaceae archaeon]
MSDVGETGTVAIADPDVGDDEARRVAEVVESGRLADGPEVRAFEREFADYCEVSRAVATSNGTTALHAALAAVGVGEDDTVLTTPFSFVASANAIRFVGATPRFVDVDPSTFALDPDAVERALRDGGVDAILAVHLYGLPADVSRLAALADEHDVALVEDAAQAHGATVDGTPVGGFGDAAAFSFYPTKNMTTGEGGMVTTDDPAVAERAARFVNHGRAADGGGHVDLGHNFRMTSLAAAMGRVQLEKLPGYVERRRDHAARLDDHLADTPVVTPATPPGRRHAYHQYTVRCGNRDAVRERLDERDIETGIYYPRAIPDQPAFDGVDAEVPVARRLADEVLSLPVHPRLSTAEVDRVGRTLATDVEVDEVAHV